MKVIRGYKTELKPNNKQRSALLQHAGTARYVWNWALNRIESKVSKPNAIQLHKEWNVWKRDNAVWYKEVSKCSPQESLRNLENAFKHFFRKCKDKKKGKFKGKAGFPRYKNKHKGIGSSRFTGTIKVAENTIQLPRLGKLRLKENSYLPINAKILSLTISEKAGKWFVSIQVEENIPEPKAKKENVVGIDLGIKTLAVCSDGKEYQNPKALKTRLRKLKMLQCSASKKVKGSQNRKKANRKVARLHYKIGNIRKDTLHKITTELTKTKSIVVIEDLCVSGMMKNHKLAQAISDVGLYEFRRQLEYKGKLYGCEIQVADRFFPSSKLCRFCGCLNDELTLADREWTCACGAVHDRDLNAAKNLESLAVSSTESLNACGEESSGNKNVIIAKLSSMKQEENVKSATCRFL